jgi:hypothetical protein
VGERPTGKSFNAPKWRIQIMLRGRAGSSTRYLCLATHLRPECRRMKWIIWLAVLGCVSSILTDWSRMYLAYPPTLNHTYKTLSCHPPPFPDLLKKTNRTTPTLSIIFYYLISIHFLPPCLLLNPCRTVGSIKRYFTGLRPKRMELFLPSTQGATILMRYVGRLLYPLSYYAFY